MKLRAWLAMLPVVLWRTMSGQTPMAYGRTYGPAADPVTQLGWGLGIISVLVVVIIGLLLLIGIFRKRNSPGRQGDPSLTVRRDAGGMSWIYIGVGISCVVLAFCVVWTLAVTAAVSRPAKPARLTVQVTASQWWWELRYTSANPSEIFTTANEIHIPTGEPVRFELSSGDVIHSFWIPQLGGKMDMVPGMTNVTWLQADQPGTYRGQCAAFCGGQHARMALTLIAQTPAEFAAWRKQELAETQIPVTAQSIEGKQVFETHCGVCHTIRGVSPAGVRGPDLSHLMERHTLAAGRLPNSPGNLAGWIANPQSIKPGVRMPNQLLSGPELIAVTSYLHTLN